MVSGCGVGGGSLGYANTLYVPPSPFFEDPQWADLDDWEAGLAPHYETAQRMLGVVVHDNDDPADQLLRELGEELGVGRHLPQDPDRRLPRQPRADGPRSLLRRRGPGADRLHAVRPLHGRLPARRQEHPGQELPLARRAPRRRGAGRAHRHRHPPARRRPTAATATRSASERSGMLRGRRRRTIKARGVIVAAGPLGTNKLLQRCRLGGSLPRISDRLGELVRTNSESILAVRVPDGLPRRPDQAGRDHLEHLPRSRTPTSRRSPTARPATR